MITRDHVLLYHTVIRVGSSTWVPIIIFKIQSNLMAKSMLVTKIGDGLCWLQL